MGYWADDIIEAFRRLGGKAHYSDLYPEVATVRGGRLPRTWQAIIRRTIENRSSDSDAFSGKEDIFYSVDGKGKGTWGLR